MVKVVKSLLPDASEAKEIADNSVAMQSSRELLELRLEITRAAKDGKYSVIRNGKLSAEIKTELNKAGYYVMIAPGEEKYCISWRTT